MGVSGLQEGLGGGIMGWGRREGWRRLELPRAVRRPLRGLGRGHGVDVSG